VELKLNGTHQLLAYADDVNLLGDNIDSVKRNIGTLTDALEYVRFVRGVYGCAVGIKEWYVWYVVA
jgi:hypothetical protein